MLMYPLGVFRLPNRWSMSVGLLSGRTFTGPHAPVNCRALRAYSTSEAIVAISAASPAGMLAA